MDLAVDVVAAVRELVGDHVAYNAYFRDFPRGGTRPGDTLRIMGSTGAQVMPSLATTAP